MNYFGTDGIRGIVGKNLNQNLLRKIAKAVVKYINKYNLEPRVLIGNDSRISSPYILSILGGVLLQNGVQIDNLGVCSSPCLAFICKQYGYPLAIMISASHNPAQYNGIKFFNSNGEKINEKTEKELENLINQPIKQRKKLFTKLFNVEKLKKNYIFFLRGLLYKDTKQTLKPMLVSNPFSHTTIENLIHVGKNTSRKNINLVIDSANGGSSLIAHKVFPNALFINDKPNGQNINEKCGCSNIERLREICVQYQRMGFALDGDGDRVCFLDEGGRVYSGDKLLYILSQFYMKDGDALVGTVYTNSGLEDSLSKRKMRFLRANVGDKKVYAGMKKTHSPLGGEDSGHIIIKKFSNTGDGLLTAILIINIICTTGLTLGELCVGYHERTLKMTSIDADKFKKDANIKFLIKKYESLGCRILLRKSGTEPVVRIMVEHSDEKMSSLAMQKIISITNKNEKNIKIKQDNS